MAPGSTGRRRRATRRSAVSKRIERGGHVVLTWAWTLCVRAGCVALIPLARGWRWLRRQRRSAQVAAVIALAVGCVAAAHAVRGGSFGAVYIDDETEALARVIRSECGATNLQQRVHVAWATRNLAASRGQTVAEMACSPCGPQELGRPVSSRQAATDADRELARAVLASQPVLDPTGGATHFINPALQDELAAGGRSGYRGRPYQRVRRHWVRVYGWEPYYRLGPDLELWGPRRTR